MPAFDTSIRDRAIKERRERLEHERFKLIYVVADTLRDIREKYGIQKAYITGSLLYSSRWHQLSDVDVIESSCSRHILSIMGDLENARDKDVDVIDLDNQPFPDSWCKKGIKISVTAKG